MPPPDERPTGRRRRSSKRFEELDWRPTPIGDISLRRRTDPALNREVYEVLLGQEYLMSSAFTVAEVDLARLTLAEVRSDRLAVVVGGLGLGYTARAVLQDPRVDSLHVVEAVAAVIDWHERELLPHAAELTGDSRCTLVHEDFFSLVANGLPFGPDGPTDVDAILVDIDHTPRHVLHGSHAPFYSADGLRSVARRLHPGGAFGLWSDVAPDEEFCQVLAGVFATSTAHVVTFPNSLTGGDSANTVYVATVAR